VWVPFDRSETSSTTTDDHATYSQIELDGEGGYYGPYELHDYNESCYGKGFGSKELSSVWPKSYMPRCASEVEVGRHERQLRLMNATWVEEPLIVDMECIRDGERMGQTGEGSSTKPVSKNILLTHSCFVLHLVV
jgi:hypothetical protein